MSAEDHNESNENNEPISPELADQILQGCEDAGMQLDQLALLAQVLMNWKNNEGIETLADRIALEARMNIQYLNSNY